MSIPMLLAVAGCGAQEDVASGPPVLSVPIGLAGGVVEGLPGTPFEGVRLVIPDLGLDKATTITVTPVAIGTSLPDTTLPVTAESIGPYFEIGPAGLVLQKPATLTLPVDLRSAASFGQDYRQVKVWLLGPDATWSKKESTDTANAGLIGSVSVSIDALGTAGAGVVVAAATGRCTAPCDTQRTGTAVPLPKPAFAGRLAVAGDRAAVVAVEPSAAGATLTGEVVPLGGEAVAVTASVTIPSAAALWPGRGLALVDDTVFVGVEGGLVRLSPADGGVLDGETLAVETVATGTAPNRAAWVVLEDGKVVVHFVDAQGRPVGQPLVTARTADGPIPAAADGQTLALGVQDHVVLISLGDVPAVVSDVPLVAGSRIDTIAANGVSLDRSGRVRSPDGLALEGIGEVSHLSGSDKVVYGLVPGASVAVRIESTTKPTRPGEVPPFEASKVTQLNLGPADSPVARAMRTAEDGALVVLDRTGAIVVYR